MAPVHKEARPPAATSTSQSPPSGTAPSDTPPASQAVPTTFDREAHATEFSRLLAFSDGVFAIALTLLVLDLALPSGIARGEVGRELLDRQAHFIAFGISLLLVGGAWWSHHRLFSMFQGVNGTLVALNILYLGLVVLIPFTQGILAGYPLEPLSYVLFAGVVAAIGMVDSGMFVYARRRGLLRAHVTSRAVRLELFRGAVFVLVYLASMPLAYLLGPYTVLVWLSQLPLDFLLGRMRAAEAREAPSG